VQVKNFIQNQPIHEVAQDWDLSFEGQEDIDVLDITDQGLFYRISSIFRYPLQDLDAYVDKTSHVWTHSRMCERTAETFDHFDRVVYIIRDPRDAALSMSRFAFTPYMQRYYPQPYETPEAYLDANLSARLRAWFMHVGPYLAHADALNLHVVFYEQLLSDFQAELDRLLDALDLALSPSQREQIEKSVAFQTMKEDNPDHVRKGKAGKWMDRMTASQKETAVDMLGPVLERLGYPTRDVDPASIRPTQPKSLTQDDLDRMQRHMNYPTLPSKAKHLAKSIYRTLT
jgi:aryl sulfotransferase